MDLQAATAAAVRTVESNVVAFAERYPDDATEGGVYPPRRARKGYPPGSHTGWTTGFWAGMLWLAYELTGDARFRQAGETQVERFAERLELGIDVDHHDLGFLYTLSCVAAWRLTHNARARDTAVRAADVLMRRYLPAPGVLQAWGTLDDPHQRGRTIVDSLMNVPLLVWASEVSGDERYAAAGRRHAEVCARTLVRPDGSTFHTYYFDASSGAPLRGATHQGFSDDSTWSRGQAWAIYGFALTGQRPVAQRVARYFVDHTPADGVVYWDFTFGDGSGEPKDSSASAIAACGLLELGERAAAERIVAALWNGYAARDTRSSNALLLHGTQNKPGGTGIDAGNLWGDYFYLEALLRLARPDWRPYW